jgi:cytochrome oxidase Cu insertion factor (SCO1/SenC/PrrC family)
MNGTLLGFASLAIALANGAWFFGRMQRVALPQNRIAHELLWAAALVLGVAAFGSAAGWLGAVPAALGALVGGFMLLIRLGSPQAKNTPAVALGGKILDFDALDENGELFSLARLSGEPFLLKFFRGHW